MKKGILAFAAGLFILASCNDGVKGVSTNDGNDHEAMAKKNSEHNREVYRAIETGDVSKLDSFIAKDFIDYEGNMGKDIVGVDSVKHYLSQIHNYFEGLKIETISEATSLDGNYHFAMVRMTGKIKENPWGMPVGQDMDDMSIDVVKIKDGKATEHWSFTSMKDMMEMMNAMGGDHMQPSMKDSVSK